MVFTHHLPAKYFYILCCSLILKKHISDKFQNSCRPLVISHIHEPYEHWPFSRAWYRTLTFKITFDYRNSFVSTFVGFHYVLADLHIGYKLSASRTAGIDFLGETKAGSVVTGGSEVNPPAQDLFAEQLHGISSQAPTDLCFATEVALKDAAGDVLGYRSAINHYGRKHLCRF